MRLVVSIFVVAVCAAYALASRGDGADPTRRSDVLEAALALARRDDPAVDANAVRRTVAELADAYRAHVGTEPARVERARGFAWLMFDHAGFSSTDDLTSFETLHVDRVLASRRGYCLSLTVIALAVAELVDEPLSAVALPHHVLVRWDDGQGTRHALELTERGRVLGEDELRARIGPFAREDTIYGRALTTDEVRGMLLHNRAFVLAGQGQRAAALVELDAARALAPTLPEIERTRGVVHGELRAWDDALAAFERALVLHPGDVDTLINMALTRHAAGRLDEAREDAEMARLLDPSHPRLVELGVALDTEAVQARHPLGAPPPGLLDGLRVEFFADTSLSSRVATAITTDIDFDWRSRPARGVPPDRFSTRVSGWLEVPVAGAHTFFVVANDGVRITVGERSVVDHWRAASNTSWTLQGEVVLGAGWHPVTFEHYDERGGARLVCVISRDGDEYPLDLARRLHHVAR